jgi:hypothetical protein
VRAKLLAVVGGSAVLAAACLALGANTWTSGGAGSVDLAGTHSTGGATGTGYVQPKVGLMSLNPTAMSVGPTVTVSAGSVSTVASTLATPFAAPAPQTAP